MKFLKQKNINKFNATDQTLFVNHYGRAVMNLTGGLRLPAGTTSQRPQTSGVRYPASGVSSSTEFADGMIRYNTTTNTLEALIAGVWEVVRAPGASTITKQTLGPGDSISGTDGEFLFGTLNSSFAYSYTASPDNVIVLVENVMQISTTNYEIVQNPCSVTGDILSFTSGTKTITSSNTSVINFSSEKFRAGQSITVSGSASNDGTYTLNTVTSSTLVVDEALSDESAGATITINGLSSATGYLAGSTYPSGYYIHFTDPVPNTKYVTVFYGYAN